MSYLTSLSKGESNALHSKNTTIARKRAIISRHVAHHVRKLFYTKDPEVFKRDHMLGRKRKNQNVNAADRNYRNKTIFSNKV